MSALSFAEAELAAAVTRGVRQCVVIDPPPPLVETIKNSPDRSLQVFTVAEQQPSDGQATFVPTRFPDEALASALEKSDFDKGKASLFVWLGGAAYRTIDTVIASLAFIASLPSGSGVVFDYAVERTSIESLSHTALDALASRISLVSGGFLHLVQPQAVAGMLGSLGFSKIVDLAQEEFPESGRHLVSALV